MDRLKMLLTLIAGVCLVTGPVLASVSGFICPQEQDKLRSLLEKSLASAKDDLSTIYYSSRGLQLLKKPAPADVVKGACDTLSKSWSPASSLENTFYIVASFGQLGCPGTVIKKELTDKVQSLINEQATTADVRYALHILQAANVKLADKSKVVSLVQAKLKSDDSLLSFGHAFQAATLLGPQGQFAYDRIEDIVVQADEIDGKMLQFEGGLYVTSLLLTGIMSLSSAVQKPLPLTQVQVEKFGNYLLSRKTVQTAKGICALLECTYAVTATRASPVSITAPNSGRVDLERRTLTVKVCDMLGQPLSPSAASVVALSATRLADDVVVLSKQKLRAATDDKTLFELDMKHEPGRYRVAVNVNAAHSASLSATILGTVAVQWLEIGVADSDQSSAPKLQKLSYPNRLGAPLEADSQQRLVVRFSLGGGTLVHQAFVRLECVKTKREIVFVAEADSGGTYKFDVDVGSKTSDLGLTSGTYEMELLVGDAIYNPIRWSLATASLHVPASAAASSSSVTRPQRGPRPEIQHVFRTPEKRPPEMISTLFTALVLSPFLVLLVLWAKIGLNIQIRFPLSALAFHAGLTAIFGLYYIFWLQLDMFTTCKWLMLFGAVTFLAGHRLLSSLARQK